MGSLVSSRLDYMNGAIKPQISREEIDHEIKHLNKRKLASKAATFIFTALAVVSLVGVLGLGHILFGAFAATALLSYVYANLCADAQKALKEKKIILMHPELMDELSEDEGPTLAERAKALWNSA